MNAQDYFKELETDVIDFTRHWHEQHKLNPDQFPLDLPPGDWLEQFLLFINLKDPNG